MKEKQKKYRTEIMPTNPPIPVAIYHMNDSGNPDRCLFEIKEASKEELRSVLDALNDLQNKLAEKPQK